MDRKDLDVTLYLVTDSSYHTEESLLRTVNSLLYAIQEKVLTKYYKSHMEDELSEKEKQKRDDRLRRMEEIGRAHV